MASQMQIDQAGLPAGTAGEARTDGKADGSLVTLTNTTANPNTTFYLLWTPPQDTTAVGSLVPTGGNPHIWTFSPTVGVYGTYLIELVENEGLENEVRERRVLRVRYPVSGVVPPALNEIADPNASLLLAGASQIEASDDNATDYLDATLNFRNYAGWWRVFEELFLAVENASGGGGGSADARTGVIWNPNEPTNAAVPTYQTWPEVYAAAIARSGPVNIYLQDTAGTPGYGITGGIQYDLENRISFVVPDGRGGNLTIASDTQLLNPKEFRGENNDMCQVRVSGSNADAPAIILDDNSIGVVFDNAELDSSSSRQAMEITDNTLLILRNNFDTFHTQPGHITLNTVAARQLTVRMEGADPASNLNNDTFAATNVGSELRFILTGPQKLADPSTFQPTWTGTVTVDRITEADNLGTDELNTALVLQPDGSGGVQWGAAGGAADARTGIIWDPSNTTDPAVPRYATWAEVHAAAVARSGPVNIYLMDSAGTPSYSVTTGTWDLQDRISFVAGVGGVVAPVSFMNVANDARLQDPRGFFNNRNDSLLQIDSDGTNVDPAAIYVTDDSTGVVFEQVRLRAGSTRRGLEFEEGGQLTFRGNFEVDHSAAGHIYSSYAAGARTVEIVLEGYENASSFQADTFEAANASSTLSFIAKGSPQLEDPAFFTGWGGGPVTKTLQTDAFNEGYTPTTPGDWSVVPNNVGIALDLLAAAGPGGGVQHNVTAIVDPTATDDSGSGYAKRSQWLNTTTGVWWICTDPAVAAAQWQAFSNDERIVATSISGTETNYGNGVAGFEYATFVRVGTSGDQIIQGIRTPAAHESNRFILYNVDATQNVTLERESASAVGSEIYVPGDTDLVLEPDHCVILEFDRVMSPNRWRVVGGLSKLGAQGPANAIQFATNGNDNVRQFTGSADLAWNDSTKVLTLDGKIEELDVATFGGVFNNGNSGGGTVTINWNNGQKQLLTLTGDPTFAFTDPPGPGNFMLIVTQDGTGGRDPSWPATGVFAPSATSGGNGSVAIASGAGVSTAISFYFDGSNYFVTGTGPMKEAVTTDLIG